MPQVPRFTDEIQTRQAPQIRLGTDAPIEAFGGGRAFNQAIDTAVDFAQKVKNDADQVAVMEADRKLTEFETQLLHDKDNGALNKRGEDAFTLPDTVKKSMTDKVAEIEKGLFGAAQKQTFARISQDRLLSVDRKITDHVANETKTYEDQKTAAYIEAQQQAAMNSFMDSESISRSATAQEVAIRAYGDRNGIPAEKIEQSVLKAKSQTHTGALLMMLENELPEKAQVYFESAKSSMTGDDQLRVSKLLDKANTAVFADKFAEKMLSDGKSLTEANEEIRTIEDVKKKEAARDAVFKAYADKKTAEDYDRMTVRKRAEEYVAKGKPIPLLLKERLSPGDLAEFKMYSKNVAEGKFVATDIKTVNDLTVMASNPATRSEFLKLPISSDPYYLNRLDEQARLKFITLQNDLRSGKMSGKKSKELNGLWTNQQMIATALDQMKIKPKSDQAALLKQRAAEEYQTFVEDNGRAPKGDEMQSMIDDLTAKVITEKGFIWDTKKRKFELTPDEEIKASGVVSVDDIPVNSKREIEVALSKKNKPITDQAIITLYNKIKFGAK